MTIISNNCTGGYIYKQLHMKYDTPFMWTNVIENDFVNIVQNYENINFNNYTISYDKYIWQQYLPANTLTTTVHVDNLFNIYYTHHLYKENQNELILAQPHNRYIYITKLMRLLNKNI